ncbi:hypothetical protein LCGC14_0383590 [marine sediment metagenome]|uniref:Uncharacterized protein n=1 Tax=marine sediment metagenome TaxID=412755 RepID=A0A0F9T1M8_9ZZZZ
MGMIYQFRCPMHGLFEVEQPMHQTHEALCSICQSPTWRVYSPLAHYWSNPKPLYHKDGSYEEKY